MFKTCVSVTAINQSVNWDTMSSEQGVYSTSELPSSFFICIHKGLVLHVINICYNLKPIQKATKETFGEYLFRLQTDRKVNVTFKA